MSAFNKSPGLLKDHVGDLDMPFRRLVECGCDDFGFHASAHVGDLFRTFVDQQDDLIDFRMVVGDRIGDGLEEHGLTRLWLGHDKAALTLPDWSEHIDYPAGYIVLVTMAEKVEFLIREEGSQKIERYPVADVVRRTPVDILNPDEREILVSLLRRPDFSGHGVTRLECVVLYLSLADVDVVRGVQVVVI